jgi:hypothetical protein
MQQKNEVEKAGGHASGFFIALRMAGAGAQSRG